MSFAESPPSDGRLPLTGRQWYPGLVLAIAIALTVAGTGLLVGAIQRTDAERFAASADAIQARILQRLDTFVAMLRGTTGLIAAHGELDRAALRTYVEHLDLRNRYPGIQGIGWTVRVPAGGDEVQRHWSAVQGLGEIAPWPARDPEHNEHQAIALIEPLDDANRSVLGFDMASEPVRRAAMETARDQDRAVASGPTTLMQQVDHQVQPGFLLYLPVYRGEAPGTVEERRAQLRGYVYAPLRSIELLHDVLGREEGERVVLAVQDADAGAAPQALPDDGRGLIFASTPGPAALPGARHEAIRNFEVCGRTWVLHCRSTRAYEESSSMRLVPWFTGAGLLFAVGLYALARSQNRAVNANVALYRECLDGRREAEINLEVSKRLASRMDLPGVAQAVVDAGRELTGASFGVFFRPDPAVPTGLQVSALSGAGNELLAHLAIPRITELLASAIAQQRIVRVDDPHLDVRYSSRFGMTPGVQPLASYLAIPVVSHDGSIVGGLLYGHLEIGRFTASHERMLLGIAAQAAIAIDNASLFEAEREARQTAARRADDLARANAELQQFAYVSSHDLQEPLRTVSQYLDLLRRRHGPRLNDQARRYIAYASESATRMYSLLNDLLTYSRIGRSADREAVPLQELVDEVRHDLAARISEAGAEIVCHELPVVHCERSKLRLVFQNLLSNALKFRGSAAPRCEISAAHDADGLWTITITDNGIGISPEHHGIIFEVFERLHDRENFPGTGIGLAICRKVIDQHGGRIWVESTAGSGSAFRFTLPEDGSHSRPVAAIRPHQIPASPTPTPLPTSPS